MMLQPGILIGAIAATAGTIAGDVATVASNGEMTSELLALVKTGGALGCLVVAVRWLAAKFSDSQREIVDLLRGVIAENSRMLTEVKDTLKHCHKAANDHDE